LAVAIDIGEANDIHPRNKQDVGGRLVLAARGIAYGQSSEYSGPVLKSMEVTGGKAHLRFEQVGGELVAKGGERLKGFAIAGADQHFAPSRGSHDTPDTPADRLRRCLSARRAAGMAI
jgi:sialate O-acetylesterase